MVGKTVPQQKSPMSYPLTPHDDAKKLVNEVLKRVDQFIHKGDFDQAQVEIIKAKEVDPRNIYAHALEERISILKAELTSLEETQQKKEPTSSPVIVHISKTETEIPQASTSPRSTPTTSGFFASFCVINSIYSISPKFSIHDNSNTRRT